MSSVDFLDQLLDGAEVEWKPLGDVLVRTKGTKITAGQMKGLHKEDGTVKIFAGGRTVAFVNPEDIPAKEILQNLASGLIGAAQSWHPHSHEAKQPGPEPEHKENAQARTAGSDGFGGSLGGIARTHCPVLP